MTIVPRRGGVRLACNRDEQRSRPPALPPRRRRAGGQSAIWPIDPAGGGTWIGVNEAGLVACLLNRSYVARRTSHVVAPVRPAGRRSRGVIVPAVLERARLDDAIAAGTGLAREAFAPFTLVLLHGNELAIVGNAGGRVALRREPLRSPLIFTSSSLGDRLVEEPRRALFDELVIGSAAPLRGQAIFHRHQWADRPEISVRMSRPDAATVSRTVVDVERGSSFIRYTPLTS